jgi:hypothetical protein
MKLRSQPMAGSAMDISKSLTVGYLTAIVPFRHEAGQDGIGAGRMRQAKPWTKHDEWLGARMSGNRQMMAMTMRAASAPLPQSGSV